MLPPINRAAFYNIITAPSISSSTGLVNSRGSAGMPMAWQSTQSTIRSRAAASMAWRVQRAVARDLRRHLKTILVISAARRNLDWNRAWPEYLGAVTITGACSAVAFPLSPHLGLVTIVMFYLLGTTVGALRLERGPSAFAAVTNMLAFNYFFVPPVFSFHVDDPQYVFALGVMLIVALVIANLMISIRRHRDTADARQERTAVLYAMSRELAAASDAAAMVDAAVNHIGATFHCSVTVLARADNGRL